MFVQGEISSTIIIYMCLFALAISDGFCLVGLAFRAF